MGAGSQLKGTTNQWHKKEWQKVGIEATAIRCESGYCVFAGNSVYGLKGVAAYADHAAILGQKM
ncbi:MAG: hypothetical protein R2861_09490 [Desulfobacterales bacterium]